MFDQLRRPAGESDKPWNVCSSAFFLPCARAGNRQGDQQASALGPIGRAASDDDAVALPNFEVSAIRYLLRLVDSILVGSALEVH